MKKIFLVAICALMVSSTTAFGTTTEPDHKLKTEFVKANAIDSVFSANVDLTLVEMTDVPVIFFTSRVEKYTKQTTAFEVVPFVAFSEDVGWRCREIHNKNYSLKLPGLVKTKNQVQNRIRSDTYTV